MEKVSEQLIDDHTALDRVLKQLQSALRSRDIEVAHSKLDLFWARLAVHIRAEHLHLFPTVLSSLEKAAVSHESVPTLDGGADGHCATASGSRLFHARVGACNGDHAPTIDVVGAAHAPEGLNNVENIVLEVEERLVKHNELEEMQVYRWATILLNSEEQAKLANQITTQLHKHPPRFNLSTWLDE